MPTRRPKTTPAKAPARAAAADHDPPTVQVAMRLEPALLARIDAWADKLNGADPTRPRWSRTALVRAVMLRALEEHGAAGTEP